MTYFPLCVECGWSKRVYNKERELCPECGKPLLYGCPVCGARFEFVKQRYCGLRDCDAKNIPMEELVEKIKRKEIEPLNSSALMNVELFLDKETIEYFEEKIEERRKRWLEINGIKLEEEENL